MLNLLARLFNHRKEDPRIRIRAERRGERIVFAHHGIRTNTLAITFTLPPGENLSGEAFGRTYILDTFAFEKRKDATTAVSDLTRHGLIALFIKE